MSIPGSAFDPNGAVRFDLKRGEATRTTTDARGTPLVLVPAAALEALERTSPEALLLIGREIGRGSGERVAARLGGGSAVRAATLELVVSHLAGEFALAGLGVIHLERWGRAMVVVAERSVVRHEGFVGAVLAGALGAATGRDVAIAALGQAPAREEPGLAGLEGEVTRYFVGTGATVARVRSLVSQGTVWTEILATIQKGAA